MGMIDIIKEASIGAVGAGNPVAVCSGEILSISEIIKKVEKNNIIYNIADSISELTIKIDQKLTLEKEFFVIPKNLTTYEAELKHKHLEQCSEHKETDEKLDTLIIREGLKTGDKVLLLKVQGGQEYVVLGKVM